MPVAAKRSMHRLLALLCVLLITSGCDNGTPGGGPLQSPQPDSSAVGSPVPDIAPEPTLTAISILAAQSTPVTVNDEIASPTDLDVCTLLTRDEAESLTGLTLKTAEIVQQSSPGAKCRYEAEGTSVSIMVLAPLDEAHAARHWRNQHNLYQHEQLSEFYRYVPGVGDAAVIYVPDSASSAFMSQRFWYVAVKKSSMYFEMLWLTDKEDPMPALVEMARKVASRL